MKFLKKYSELTTLQKMEYAESILQMNVIIPEEPALIEECEKLVSGLIVTGKQIGRASCRERV